MEHLTHYSSIFFLFLGCFFILSGSIGLIKLPDVSVTVKATPAETAYLKNPVAPLLFPSTKVPALSVLVGPSFIESSVIV